MVERFTRLTAVPALALVATAFAASAPLDAQDGRSRVLIPDLFYAEGTDDDFGKDVAKKLRELMEEQVRFTAIEKDDIEDTLDRFDMRMRDLDCLGTRQLAQQVNAKVVFCATYQEVADKTMEFTEIAFYPVGGGEPFNIDLFTIGEKEDEEAAQQIIDAFDRFVELEQFRTYCYDYSNLQQWDDAERNCSEALAVNPEDSSLRFQLAQVYRSQERFEEALVELDQVLEADPYNADALNTAGYLATQQGDNDKGREYYTRYLEITPDAAAVRRRIAYDIYTAGDPEGAMNLLEEGLGEDADIGIYSDFGTYAFNTAREKLEAAGIDPSEEGQSVPGDVAELYRTAIGALERVYEAQGDSALPSALRNVVVARIQLGELAEAEAFGAQISQTFPDEEGVWVSYAQALQLQDKVDEAISAWSEVERINPDYPNLFTRQANLLLAADRRDDAIGLLRQAVAKGTDPTVAARLIFADAHGKGVAPEQKNYGYALAGFVAAKEFQPDPMTTQMLNFWHGFVRYEQGRRAAAPETAAAARQALPLFQEAKTQFGASREYAASQSGINLQQFLDATDQFIEIQQLLIEAGR
jgi:tetratricopeptide (TPR) repeat protein